MGERVRGYVVGIQAVVFVLLLSGVVEAGKWIQTGTCNTPRSGQQTAVLTNGKIMAMGGYFSSDTYEIFDPATGMWTEYSAPIDSDHEMGMLLPNGNVLLMNYLPMKMHQLYDPRAKTWTASTCSEWDEARCATLLRDGDVLMMYDGFGGGKKCKLYDYMSDTETSTGACSEDHEHAVEVLLPSGEVLTCGTFMTGGTEVYSPLTGQWTSKGSMNRPRVAHVAVLLPPPWNKVLAAGGSYDRETELYDIGSGSWAYTSNHPTYYPRWVGAMALLPSGKALLVGGHAIDGCTDRARRQCELFEPSTNRWSSTANTLYDRGHHALSLLPTGKVLAVGNFERPIPQCEIYDPANGSWTVKPSLNIARARHTTTPLPIVHTSNCSTNVLITGGENSSGALDQCELYNYSLDSMSVTGTLNQARSHHTAVLLPSGEVLVTGGKSTSALNSSELYSVLTEMWTTTGPLSNARFDHAATLAKDGKVLVTGGEFSGTYLNSCEVYSGGSWTATATMATSRSCHATVVLLDGKILVIGGKTTGGSGTASCEVWDGSIWSPRASMSTARYWHSVAVLQSGKVLVAGGTSNGSTPFSSCEIYDPDLNSWSSGPSLNQARYAHNGALLYSGMVMVSGGRGSSSCLSSCEIYDPATGEWRSDNTGTLATARAYHSSVHVPGVKPFVLAFGGDDGTYLSSVEQHDVGLGYRSEWQSTITNFPSMTHVSDPMQMEGTLFRGISEADGGNYCHISSNDHPIISLLRVGGGNWQGNGGGAILHMPLSSSWDETHTNVHPLVADFEGYFRLWSIVNGIPCKWYEVCNPEGIEDSQQSTVHSRRHLAYPNPVTHNTVVKFVVHGSEFVDEKLLTLKIYDLSGRVVRSLQITKSRDQQMIEMTPDGLNPGIYFYKIGRQDTELKGKFTVVE